MIAYTSSIPIASFKSGLLKSPKKILSRSVTFRRLAPETFLGSVKALLASAKEKENEMRILKVPILMSTVLLGGLLLVSTTKVDAQVACLGTCEELLVQCLRGSGTKQQSSGNCLEQFDSCVNQCLSRFAIVFDDRPLTEDHKPLAEIGGPTDEQPV